MKSIAMRCTQEDWDSVKSEIENHRDIICFKTCEYLVTNCLGQMGVVSNMHVWNKFYSERTVYETFDKDILFDALDIEVDYVWEPVNMKFFDGNKWVEVTDAKVKKPKNPELTELKEKAKSLGFKLVPLFLLLFFNLGFSQQAVQHFYVASQNLAGAEIMINNGNDIYFGGGFSGTLKNEFTRGEWAGKHISDSEMKYSTGIAKEEWCSIYAIGSFGYFKSVLVSCSAGMGLYGQMMNFERNGIEYNKNDKLIFTPLIGITGQYAVTKDVGLMLGADTFNGVKIGVSIIFN